MAAAAGTTPPDLWGVTREAFALKAAAADVGDGPATDLMTTAAHEVIERHTGAAAVDLKDKAMLRGLGLNRSAAPCLGSLSPEGAEHRALDAIASVLNA